jgi:hypothetical protein
MGAEMKIQSQRVGIIILVALAVSGCSTVKIHEPNRALLELSLKAIESGTPGNLAKAEVNLKKVLANTGNYASEYPVQRFFAHYLLSQVHMTAAAGNAFLTESKAETGFSIDGGGSTAPSNTAHLVATNFNAYHALAMHGAARNKPLAIGNQQLLPASLKDMGIASAARHLQLCILTAYSQMLFESEANNVFKELGVSDLESLTAVMEEGHASAHMKPWICYAMWRRLYESDPRTAFRFAAKAIEYEDALGLGTEELHQPIFKRWLTDPNTPYLFVCGTCGEEVELNSMTCLYCSAETKLIDYQFVLREKLAEWKISAGITQ